MSILGLDIGTTGVKAVAFREDGEFIASAYREYALLSPQPGHLELDPREVLEAIRQVTREVSSRAADDPVRSVATSTLGEAAVPVDKAGRAIAPAIIGFDTRGGAEMEEFKERISNERVFEITGHPINSYHTLFKVLWRRRQTPEIFAKARQYLCFGDYTAASLGLPPRIDHSMASRLLAFDIHRKEYSKEILGAAGLPEDVFAPAVAPGEPIGEVGENGFGLPRGCVMAGGLHDQPAGILGAAVQPGEAMLATGTVICLGVRLRAIPAPAVMIAGNLAYYPTAGERQFVSIAFNFTGGSLLKWYRDQLSGGEVEEAARRGVDPYEVICAGLPERPTSLMVLPHFTTTGTPWLDRRALGAVLGLRLTTSRKEIVKAILEGIVFEIKLNSELLADAGVEIDLYKAIGGASRSRTWMQIAADILDRPVAVLAVDKEGAALGAALMGARGAGIVRSDSEMHEIVRRSAQVVDILEPRRDQADLYAARYEIYKDIYPATRDLSHRLFALEE